MTNIGNNLLIMILLVNSDLELELYHVVEIKCTAWYMMGRCFLLARSVSV